MTKSTNSQLRIIYSVVFASSSLLSIYAGFSEFSLTNLLLIESTVITSLVTLSMLLREYFTGVIVAPLRYAVKLGTILTAAWLPLYLFSSGFTRFQTIPLVAIVWIVIIYVSVQDAVNRSSQSLLWVVISGAIVSIEVLAGIWVMMTQLPDSQSIGSAIIVSGVVSATFPLLNLSKRRGKIYSQIAAQLSNNVLRNTIITTTLFIYVLYLRGYIIGVLADNYSLLNFIEWTTLTVALFVVYRKARRVSQNYVRPEKNTDWRKHIQVITSVDDEKLWDWEVLIDSFIKRSEKDVLCIKLVDLLRNRQVPITRIQEVLTGLLNYHEAQPSLLSFSKKDHVKDEIAARRQIMETIVGRISEEYG